MDHFGGVWTAVCCAVLCYVPFSPHLEECVGDEHAEHVDQVEVQALLCVGREV